MFKKGTPLPFQSAQVMLVDYYNGVVLDERDDGVLVQFDDNGEVVEEFFPKQDFINGVVPKIDEHVLMAFHILRDVVWEGRQPGERVVVKYPHHPHFGRKGKLIEIVEKMAYPEGIYSKNIWAVRLDPVDHKPAAYVTFNEYWLHLDQESADFSNDDRERLTGPTEL
jgi:hypothetical protein